MLVTSADVLLMNSKLAGTNSAMRRGRIKARALLTMGVAVVRRSCRGRRRAAAAIYSHRRPRTCRKGRWGRSAIVAPSGSIDFVVLGLAIFLGGVIGVP
jgi:hypothetical protein